MSGCFSKTCALALLLFAGLAQAGIAEQASRTRVAGVDLIVYPTAVKDVVTIRGALPAGEGLSADDNPAVPALVAMMLDRGTVRQDKYAVAAQLEDVGASIGFGVCGQALCIEAKSRSSDLPLVIELIAEQLRMPAFSAAEFERVRQQRIGSLENERDDVGYRAGEAFNRAAFPDGHPNRQPSLAENLAATRRATLGDLGSFHRRHYGPASLTLVLVGDVEATPAQRLVARAFEGWNGGGSYVSATRAPAPTGARDEAVHLEEKASVSVTLGQPTGLRYRDPDALALRMGTAILGSGFTGRLMASVRDREGLTYGIGAGVSGDTFNDGSWSISATFAPQMLARGIAATRRELAQWWREGVTAEELAFRKQQLVGSFQVGLATTQGLADALLQTTLCGYGLDWLDAYPARIEALTRDEVNAAIRKRLDPQKMILVRAGTLPETAGAAP